MTPSCSVKTTRAALPSNRMRTSHKARPSLHQGHTQRPPELHRLDSFANGFAILNRQ